MYENEGNIFKQMLVNYTATCLDIHLQDLDIFTILVLDPSAVVKLTVADECGLISFLYLDLYVLGDDALIS